MKRPTTVTVIGTGAFAAGFCRGVIGTARIPLRLVVLGRSGAALRRFGEVHATSSTPVEAVPVDLSPDIDLTAVLAMVGADAVVCAASLYSPYRSTGDRRSTRPPAGFGVTSLLQAPFAVRAGEAAARLGLPLFNACYPDLVNPLLVALGLPIVCGLGNVHTLTSNLTRPTRMLAHHRHLGGGLAEKDDVLVVGPDRHEVRTELREIRGRPRRTLNDSGAAAAGTLVAAMLAGERVRAERSGPGGLPGGYPVDIHGLSCRVDLPPEIDLESAVAWNQRHGSAEGAVVTPEGDLHFIGVTAETLRESEVITADRVPCHRWETVARRQWRAHHRVLAAGGME